MAVTLRRHALLAASLLTLGIAGTAQAADIQILSAVVKDQKIAGATVILQKNGAQSAVATTNDQGAAQPRAEFPDSEDTLVIVKKDGYSTLVAKCPCNGMTYALSPVMTNLDGLRVVLNWGAKPADLDLHVAYPRNHIFWNNKTKPGADANLDIDHINGFGPETITIERKHPGEAYVFAIHDYTNREQRTASALSASGAKVMVYVGQSLVRSYYVPANVAGNLWTVFRITPEGEFQDINTVKGTTLDANTVLNAVDTYLDSNTRVEARAVSAGERQSATALNRDGEKAYHAGNLEGAAELFRQAIDIDSEYGQAYSNLGLTYQKLNRTSEAIWANRKAIALASGNSAATVRASSYYNIAKIYEQAQQYQDALQHYELAKGQKDNPVYTQAIERVKGLMK
ncbi:MAG: tetratricopeptide repeat protein [Bacteroidales bacterium]